MVVQKNHVLLRFLKLRLVVNGMHIYALMKNKPVVVTLPTNPSRIVVTDGFHITQPMNLAGSPKKIHYFSVECAIQNDLLIGGFVFMLMLFAMGASADFLLLKIVSTLPVVYILFLYYIRRKEFIRIRPA